MRFFVRAISGLLHPSFFFFFLQVKVCGSANGRQVAPESALYVADMAKKLQKFCETGEHLVVVLYV